MAATIIEDADGVVFNGRKWRGTLKLIRCTNVRIIDCEGHGAGYAGLWLEDCPGALVSGGDFHDNGGHGIHLGGDCTSVVVADAVLRDNLEDGIQMANSARNRALFQRCWFMRNSENGFDGKAGSATFLDCRFNLNGTGLGPGGGREQVIVQQGDDNAETRFENLVMVRCALLTPAYVAHSSCVRMDGPHCTARLADCILDARYGENQCIRASHGARYVVADSDLLGDVDNPDKALVRSTEMASGLIEDCRLVKPVSDRKWFKVDGEHYGKAFDLDVANLTVRNCR